MKPRTICILVVGFIVAHFCMGLFFFCADISSPNFVLAHYAREHPRSWMDTGRSVFWFPAGPLSGFVWALPFYGILKLIAWVIHREK